ncbi:MAG TPA: glycine C-acetyltransferase [Vicinamibacteria bacterium]|nr:glycine C-acetyltransferase [Vicinamibacteria bacterium]
MFGEARDRYRSALREIEEAGLFKHERVIQSSQGASISVKAGEVLNFCANNYLGLSSDPEVVRAAHAGLDARGFGMSSVRFICGTQDIHKELEEKIAGFLGTDDAILYSSCFDANGGLFETLLSEDDAVISDSLNHASIIDGIRLSKAKRLRYANRDMNDLEDRLKEAQTSQLRLIATDGVFSMDGTYAPLDEICALAERYDAMVMVDDSHATGFVGETGRGTPERFGVQARVDVVTSTLGKALGGAAGGFTSGRQEIIDLLRQRSRPYLFSNSLAPPIVSAATKVLEILETTSGHRKRLMENTQRFRREMSSCGFRIVEGQHPIVPILLGDARLAQEMASDLLEEGIYVVGFSFPVVPRGQARIRVQLSAAHSPDQVGCAIEAFIKIGKKRGVI